MRRLALLVTATLVLGTVAVAQKKPDFSGRWIIDPPSKAAGQETTVKQDDKALTMSAAGRRELTHQLDGSEQRTVIPMRGGEVVMLSRAVWEGSTIVITTSTSYPNNMKTVSKEIWSIDAQGRLVIDFTETAEGQPPRVVKVTHSRKN
jgi:hypothetical protein